MVFKIVSNYPVCTYADKPINSNIRAVPFCNDQNSLFNSYNNDVDRLDLTSKKPVNSIAMPATNPFNQIPPNIDPKIKTDINIFKTASETLQKDIDSLDKKTNQPIQTLLNIFSPIPPDRRIQSVPDKIEEKNYIGAGLQVGIAAANFPSDMVFMSEAGKEIKDIFTKGVFPSSQNYAGQRPVSFFKGTLMQPLARKYNFFKNFDNTLYDTKFGEFIKKIFKVERLAPQADDLFGSVLANSDDAAEKFLFKGNFLQKTLGTSLLRTSVFGVATTALLEVPAIIRSITDTKGSIFDKGKALGKQLIKSAAYVGFINAGIALAGAALAPYGAVAGLIGMAIGSTAGLMASKEFSKLTDKIVNA